MEAIEKDFKRWTRKNLSFISYIEGVMIELILKQEIDRERGTVLSYNFCFEVSILNSTVLTYSVLKLRSEPPKRR